MFVIKQIVDRSSNTLTKTEKSSVVLRLRGAISVIVLLGLTWVFAIFAVGDFGLVFHYLFAIFNSLQGLFIFFFYCFLKTDVRNLWKRKCTCFKSPYESTDTGTRSRDRGNRDIQILSVYCIYVCFIIHGICRLTISSASTVPDPASQQEIMFWVSLKFLDSCL